MSRLLNSRVALSTSLALFAFGFVLTACGPEDVEAAPRSYAFVVGDRANSAVPDPSELVGKLPDELLPGAKMVVVGVDGSAGGVSLLTETVPEESDSFAQQEASEGTAANIRHTLDEARPAVPEANTLGAIGTAARALRAAEGDKTMIVADSMLSTAGVLQFQAGLLDAAPEDVVASVDKEELPDLSGVEVRIYGAGEVRSPQDALTESKRNKLEAIWEALLTEAGAKSVAFESAVKSDDTVSDLPPVTTVEILHSAVTLPVPAPETCTHVLSESLIQFVPDTAEFADPAVAHQTIAAVATSMHGCPGVIVVTGTTSSWGTEEGRQQVSQQRAARVRDELASAMNIEARQIVARGVGMNFPEYVGDRDPHGRLIPLEAAKNRAVRITTEEQ